MRVLYISRKFPPQVGGMQTHNYQLWRHLRDFADVELIAYRRAEWAVPFFLLPAYMRALAICGRRKPDIVFAGDGFLAPFAVSLKRHYGVTVIAQLFGLDLTWDGALYRKTSARGLRQADAVVCISRYARDIATAHGVHPERAKFIPGGFVLPHDRWPQHKPWVQARLESRIRGPLKTGPALLTVGRLVRRKGVADFIRRDLPELLRRHPGLRYMVVGAGPDREDVLAGIREKRLEKEVVCLGQVSDEELETVYALGDVFVMPNIHVDGDVEGFGLVALEAGAARLPVVASAVEGIVDAVRHGENGILASRESGSGFVDAISRFIQSHDDAREFGRAAREYVLKHFSWQEIARRYAALFRETAEAAHGRRNGGSETGDS